MTDILETSKPTIICRMSGGPNDGARYEFNYLPVALGVGAPSRGFYQRTDRRTRDGARIFVFRAWDEPRPL